MRAATAAFARRIGSAGFVGRRAAGRRSRRAQFRAIASASGIASIHFAPNLAQQQFARFVRAFPTGNAKPTSLAEQLKSASLETPPLTVITKFAISPRFS